MNERKHILILLLIITTNLFSQELFVTKRNYSDSSNYFHTLLGIDQTNGNTVNTINLSTNFSNSSQNADNSPESLVFNQATNEIIGIVGNIIVKFNIASNTETSFILPVITSSDYGDIIVANNKLFVTKRDYSNSSNYVHSLLEIDQTNGNTVNTINLSTDFSNSSQNADNSPESLVFNQATNEIIGIVGNIIVKFNIASNTETSFILPVITSSDYGDIIVANNKLFVTKRDYSNSSNYVHSLLEIDQTNGNTVNTINLSTDFSNSSQNADNSPESLVFNQATNEIIGIVGNIIVKFNIASNTETSFILPVITSSDYGDIIVAEQNSLSVENDNLILSKLIPKKAYNILGKEISLNTKNVLMIIEFENGSRKKIMKLK